MGTGTATRLHPAIFSPSQLFQELITNVTGKVIAYNTTLTPVIDKSLPHLLRLWSLDSRMPQVAHPLCHASRGAASLNLVSETLPVFELFSLAEVSLDLVTPITPSESRVMLQVVIKSITFLFDRGANYSV